MKSVLAFTAAAAVTFGAVWWLRKRRDDKALQAARATGRVTESWTPAES